MPTAPVLASTDKASNSSNATTTIAIPVPSGTADGDWLLAVIPIRGTGATITPVDTGWTQITPTFGASSISLAVFIRKAGPSEPSSYSFTTTAARQAAGMARITGADPTTPIDTFSTASGTAGTSLVAASVDPATADTLLVEIFVLGLGTTTITNPGGATSDWSFTCSPTATAAPVNALAHETLSVDTPTGTRTATAGAAGNWAAMQIVFQPPVPAAAAVRAGIPL